MTRQRVVGRTKASYAQMKDELERVKRTLEAAERSVGRIKESALSLLNTNGGPIDGADTVDGNDYVMVKLSAFKVLAVEVGQGHRL